MTEPQLECLKNQQTGSIFILVQWPWSQSMMHYDWFKTECILYNAFEEQEYLSSAYFVPLDRIIEFDNDTPGL